MEIARYTKLPDLWSGLGRAVNNLTAVCITGISLKLLSADNHSAIIIAVPILFVAVSIAALLYSVRRNSFFDEIETANNQVYDEYWEQMESDGNDGVVPVKYWHSNWDENNKVPEDKKITVFEEGKTYMYSIILKAVDGHMFSRDCTMELNDIKIKQSLVNLPTRDEYTLFAFALKTMRPSSADIQTVDSIDIKNLKTDYQPGESPVTSATLSAEDAKKVKIVYECWRDGDAYWYSDEAQYAPEDERITEFQKGGRYSYNIYFIAKDGYEFADNVRVTLDGAALPWGAFATTTQNNWNLRVTHAATLRPGDPIERIYVSDATLNFNAGDKPVFTGKTDDSLPYFVDREWWETEDGKGYETFEEGKKYYYGIYIRLTEEGVKEGLHFDENTKLSINNQDFDLSNADVDIDGETIWISRLFSITPQKSGEKPKLGDANGDGVIDINDAILTARADVGSAALGTDSAALADVNGDGKVTIHDALLIVRFGLGLIEKFPTETK